MVSQDIGQYNFKGFKEYILEGFISTKGRPIILILLILEFSLFKYYYPYPNFIHEDSYIYLQSAIWNNNINTHLVGYSRFLRLVSVISSSGLFLTSVQFLLITVGALFFVATICYFYRPHNIAKYILLFFILFNPLSLHLSNMVASDGLFLSLSFFWFATNIWILHRPRISIILTSSALLYFCFTVRYSALFYPLLSVVLLVLANISIKRKILALLIFVIPVLVFVMSTTYRYKHLTNFAQFSPFAGWQLANNAMYAYRYVPEDRRVSVPKRFFKLDKAIRVYFDSVKNVVKFPHEALLASTFYMWRRDLPLFIYRDSVFRNDTISGDFKKWASMGPLYKDYGQYIIQTYPKYYLKYYLIPNFTRYFAPPVEFLGSYNGGYKNAVSLSKEWFGFSSVSTRLKSNQVIILDFFPILSGVLNVMFIASIFSVLLLLKYVETAQRRFFIIAGTFWIISLFFTVMATAAAVRFLAFHIFFMATFTVLVLDWLIKVLEYIKSVERISLKNEMHEVIELSKQRSHHT